MIALFKLITLIVLVPVLQGYREEWIKHQLHCKTEAKMTKDSMEPTMESLADG